jgi:hypothetical protein
MAVVNGNIGGYEIKSDLDTLARLPRQRAAYQKCFDFMTIVVGSKHAAKTHRAIPRWWGILESIRDGDSVVFREERAAQRNTSVSVARVVQLLWRQEAIEVAHWFNLNPPEAVTRAELWRLLVKSVPAADLIGMVRGRIKARGYWRAGGSPFRRGDSLQASAKSQHFQKNREWLLSLESVDLPC